MYKSDKIIVFIQTDFPDPVVPAISKWCIVLRSPVIGWPEIPFPSAIGNFTSFFLKLESEIISFKNTFSLKGLGNSIPMVLLPGIVAILADSELVFLAISSERLIIFDTLTPGAGSNSYNVTTGPWLTFLTSPSTPKSNNIFSKVFSSILFSANFLSFLDGIFKRFIEGNLYFKLYKSGYAVFKNNPLFGVGNKNYRVETCDTEKKDINPEYFCTTHPHQVYFEILSEHGIFGFLIILSIIFFLTFRLLRKILLSKNYIQAGAFIYIIINLFPILPSGAFFNDFNLTLFMLNFP